MQVSKKAESVQKLRAGLPSANADLIDGQIRYNRKCTLRNTYSNQVTTVNSQLYILNSAPGDLRSRSTRDTSSSLKSGG